MQLCSEIRIRVTCDLWQWSRSIVYFHQQLSLSAVSCYYSENLSLSGPRYRFCHLRIPVIRIMKPADNTIYTRPHLQGGKQTLGGTKHTQKHPSCKPSSLYAYNPCSALLGSITYINHYNYQMNDPLSPISEPRCINKQLDWTGHLRPWETTINSMRYVR